MEILRIRWSRSGAVMGAESRLLGVNLNLYLCGTTSICGGAVNHHTGPDGKLHLPAQAASPRYSGIAYDGAAGNVKRKDPQLKPRCARFSFRGLLLMPRALCTVSLARIHKMQRSARSMAQSHEYISSGCSCRIRLRHLRDCTHHRWPHSMLEHSQAAVDSVCLRPAKESPMSPIGRVSAPN
jgi:hypothetical protein